MRKFTDIDEERGRVTVIFSESISLHDIMEMMLTSAKARVLGYPTLVDARDTRIAITPADVEAIFATHADLAGMYRFAKLAVHVNDADSLKTVEEVGSLLSKISPVRGFLDRNEAERWLGWTAAG